MFANVHVQEDYEKKIACVKVLDNQMPQGQQLCSAQPITGKWTQWADAGGTV